MTYRRLLLAFWFQASLAASAFAAACSSTDPSPFTDASDASLDATTSPRDDARADVIAMDALAERDAGVTLEAGSPKDAGADTSAYDAGGGHCSELQGPACDLVLQNCPKAPNGASQQCAPILGADGGITTACVAISGTQARQKGYPCCVGTGDDPCLAGLTCIGGDTCPTDGGAPTGKCSPYCCPGDDSVCGTDNQGIPGRCNLTIVSGTPRRSLFEVCTYSTVCRPLGVQPCAPGYACLVTDSSGSSHCSHIILPEGGTALTHRQPCFEGNACADGMECLSSADAGGLCEFLCHVPGTVTPFDAGALTQAAGHGGCPSTTPTCRTVPNLFPGWLGICL